ncbi:MAG TPA: transcription termination/antitermination NusG family protein [Gemmataceae bacterium]|nr:transcription termination/antitermination NusG family protein [Gemmataceae bacterium]
MPFVLSNTTIYPSDLLDDFDVLDRERHWWVAYTKVRQEKRLAEDLICRDVPFYLPLIERSRIYRGRRLRSQEPIFGSYVFLFADQRERARALTTNRIAHLLPVADGRRLYDDLVQVKRLIAANVPLTVEARLQPGMRVRVRHGCFAGIEGIVESRCRQTRLIVAIDFLQRGISVELDDITLEPIGSVERCL